MQRDATSQSGDDGGPAPRLALAPDSLRCKQLIRRPGGLEERCSRFTIFGAGGCREAYCVAHSKTQHAEALRAKALKAHADAVNEERERRRELAQNLFPHVWAETGDFQEARFLLGHALVLGDVTIPEFQALRVLICDAERHARSHPYDWGLVR